MPQLENESENGRPVRERLLPQTSIRFFVLLIGASALVMYTFRAAAVGDALWAKCVSLVILTVIGCFLSYAFLFLIAMPFASAAQSIAPSQTAAVNSGGQGLIASGDLSLTQDDVDAFQGDEVVSDRQQDTTESP